MKKICVLALFIIAAFHLSAQTSWNLSGNSGISNTNFLGTTDNKDLIFKVKNTEYGRLVRTGFWRFGSASDYAKIDSTGALTFSGAGAYQVAGNKYVFQYSADTDYGLFFNSSALQYEFRNGSAASVFSVNSAGDGTFAGKLRIGNYTLPQSDGTNGQVLTTNGTGVVSWSTIAAAANKKLSNLNATTEINAALLPANDSTLNLGSAAKGWKDIYIDGRLYMDGSVFLDNQGTANTFLGVTANTANSGVYNTFTGYWAGKANGSGSYNTATGSGALPENTTGAANSSFGYSSLRNNTTGQYNTGLGTQTLYWNTGGDYNTAAGLSTLFYNTTGSGNTALGSLALQINQTGYSNVAIGIAALNQNTSGHNLVAVGDSALFNQIEDPNQQYGNTAIGSKALYSNTTGDYNTATGLMALYNNNGHGNTATGNKALYTNTSGVYNTASGASALFSNSIGYGNVAAGAFSLLNNTTGSSNTAVGDGSLEANVSGSHNVAVGQLALFKSKNNSANTAVGDSAMYNYNDGTFSDYHVALGYGAMSKTTIGYENTAVGGYALATNTTGYYNTALGTSADVTSGTIFNSAAIGHNAKTNESNKYVIGDATVQKIGGYVNWTNFSDGRYKQNIKQNVPGLAFINKLKPVTYTLNVNAIDARQQQSDPSKALIKRDAQRSGLLQQSINEKSKIVYTGFVAQEVEKAAAELHYDFSGVDKPQQEDGFYGLRYGDFVVPLVKAVQELSKQNDIKNAAIDSLRKQNDALSARLDRIEQILAASNTGNTKISSQFVELSASAKLEQNIPNPFTNATTINYYLPANNNNAYINFYNASGVLIKSAKLNGTGHGTVELKAKDLPAGVYQYALLINNTVIDSKKMVQVK